MKSGPGSRASLTRLSLLAVLLLGGRDVKAALPIPATGANVDESRVTQILYVDPAHTEAADDDKHGLADLPFATFNYACQTAAKAKDANVGVKIVLAAGTYREAGMIPAPPGGKPDTDAPLVIEAAEREQAVIDGAETEGWSPSTWKVEGALWTHPWPFRRNAPAHPIPTSESYRRGALVFVNGLPLRQVNAGAEITPGCFREPVPIATGSRKKTAAGGGNEPMLAVVEPPPDTELPGAILQVGVRGRGLLINGRRKRRRARPVDPARRRAYGGGRKDSGPRAGRLLERAHGGCALPMERRQRVGNPGAGGRTGERGLHPAPGTPVAQRRLRFSRGQRQKPAGRGLRILVQQFPG